jgi:AP-1 complex subunit beta-1
VLGDKPVIEDDTFKLEPALLNTLIGQIATLSSVYHKPPEAFVVRRGAAGEGAGGMMGTDDDDDDDDNDEEGGGGYENSGGGGGEVDLLDMGGLSMGGGGGVVPTPTSAIAPVLSIPDRKLEPSIPMTKVVGPDKAGGLEVYAGFQGATKNDSRKMRMKMEIKNISSSSEIKALAIQLNKNAFGLSPASQQIVCNPPIAMGQTGETYVELIATPAMLAPPPPAGQSVNPQVQVAIKNMSAGNVFYFAANLNLESIFSPDAGPMERSAFIELWKSIDDRNELVGTVPDLPRDSCEIDSVIEKFATHNIWFIARRPVPNPTADGAQQEVVYFSMKTVTGMDFLVELTFKKGINACKLCLKTENSAYGVLAKQALEHLLQRG